MAGSIENSHVFSSNLKNFNVEILVGTYEEFVVGFKLSNNSEGGITFTPSFTNHSHCGSIRTVAVSKRFLASGSSDECIRLFCLRTRGEHGFLQHHNGTITCLEFFKNTHLFSGSEDGNVCVWNTRTWNCEKTLKAHEGGVTAISIHPSGKLALTVGKDRGMKTWNLIKGRTAYVTNIKAVADAVMWAPDGNHYAVAMNNVVNIYQVQSAGIAYAVNFKHRINFILFLNPDTLVVGGDGPDIEIHSMKEGKLLTKFKAHDKRVRAGSIITLAKDQSNLITASNDGFIKLWEVPVDGSEPTVLAQLNTSCRITSMAVWMGKIEVKPDELEAAGESTNSETVVKSTNSELPVKALKPSLKRPRNDNGVKILKTSSGSFISEPIVKRKNKRHLTFVNDVNAV